MITELPRCKQCGIQTRKGNLCYECLIRKYPYEKYDSTWFDPCCEYLEDNGIDVNEQDWLVDMYMTTPDRYLYLE